MSTYFMPLASLYLFTFCPQHQLPQHFPNSLGSRRHAVGEAPIVNCLKLSLAERDNNSFASGFHGADIVNGIKFVKRSFNALTTPPAYFMYMSSQAPLVGDRTMTMTHNDPAEAFDRAISEHRLNDNPASSYFAGKFMYMGTLGGKDQFKHIKTRKYLESFQGSRTAM